MDTPARHEAFARRGYSTLFPFLLVFSAAGLLSGCLRMQVLSGIEVDVDVCVTRAASSAPVSNCEIQMYLQMQDGSQNEFLPRSLGATDENGCLRWRGSLRYCYSRQMCTQPENKALTLMVKFILEEQENLQIAVPLEASKAIRPGAWRIELDEKL